MDLEDGMRVLWNGVKKAAETIEEAGAGISDFARTSAQDFREERERKEAERTRDLIQKVDLANGSIELYPNRILI